MQQYRSGESLFARLMMILSIRIVWYSKLRLSTHFVSIILFGATTRINLAEGVFIFVLLNNGMVVLDDRNRLWPPLRARIILHEIYPRHALTASGTSVQTRYLLFEIYWNSHLPVDDMCANNFQTIPLPRCALCFSLNKSIQVLVVLSIYTYSVCYLPSC